MKTQTQKIELVKILISSVALFLAACAGTKNDSATTTTATSYYLNGGVCYNNSGQTVASSYCSGTGTYTMSNGYCYNSSGQMVANSYCTSTGYYMNNGYCYNSSGQIVTSTYCGTTTTTSTVYGQCVGTYIYVTSYGSQLVTCAGANCRGYWLYEYATQRPVYCQ